MNEPEEVPAVKRLSGLQMICKLYGAMVIQGKRWLWDYAADVAVPEAEMPLGSERHRASERAKYAAIREYQAATTKCRGAVRRDQLKAIP